MRPDGVCSDLFEVEQGLRQGCVLPMLLFDTFAAVPAALQTFSDNTVILADLVHLKDPQNSMGSEPAINVRRAVWGMLYADDALHSFAIAAEAR